MLVFCRHPELVLLAFMQATNQHVGDVNSPHSNPIPLLPLPLLYSVSSDVCSAVVSGCLPLEATLVLTHLCDERWTLWWVWSVWNTDSYCLRDLNYILNMHKVVVILKSFPTIEICAQEIQQYLCHHGHAANKGQHLAWLYGVAFK